MLPQILRFLRIMMLLFITLMLRFLHVSFAFARKLQFRAPVLFLDVEIIYYAYIFD